MTEKQKRNSRPIFGQPLVAFSLGKVACRSRLSRKAYEGMFISGCAETNQRRVSACGAARFQLTPKEIVCLAALCADDDAWVH